MQKLLGAGFNADKSIGDLVTQGRRLAHHLPAIAVVGRPRAGLAVLAGRGDAGGGLLSDLRLAPHDRAPSIAGSRCSSARPCARWRARSTRAIAGFVRGQTAVCLILGSFYAVALTLSGLNFGLLIGLISGMITFIPYVGSMTGLGARRSAWRWRSSGRNGPRSSPCSAFSWSASSSKAICWRPSWSARASACIRSG